MALYTNIVYTYMGLRAGVDRLDSEDLCCSNERNLAILDAKSAASSYSGSGLFVPDASSVDIDGIGRFSVMGFESKSGLLAAFSYKIPQFSLNNK